MNRTEILEYYTQKNIANEIVAYSENREVAGAFLDGRYAQRPNVVQYPADIKYLVLKGITSFHYSVEKWANPMSLTSKESYESNRIGWDYIIDIDSSIGMDGAKIVAENICNLLEQYGIKTYGIKFSGSRGFHICLPWQMMPKTINYTPTEKLYPSLPNILSSFIRHELSEKILKDLVKRFSAKVMGTDNPYNVVDIEKNWGNRHMFRAPYSLNEKSWLVSLPLKSIDDFSIDVVKPENIQIKASFFKKNKKNEAEGLIVDALEWYSKNTKPSIKKQLNRKIVKMKRKIPEEFFPPCIKTILMGLKDGRKRSIFTLINFLRSVNWSYDEIWSRLEKWNQNNKPPLSKTIMLSQLKWNQTQDTMMPANCDNDLFYKGIGIKCDKSKCNVKNPVNYAFRKYKPKRTSMFKCHICKKEFKTLNGLKIHIARIHGEE